jgi:hypothetical protein
MEVRHRTDMISSSPTLTSHPILFLLRLLVLVLLPKIVCARRSDASRCGVWKRHRRDSSQWQQGIPRSRHATRSNLPSIGGRTADDDRRCGDCRRPQSRRSLLRKRCCRRQLGGSHPSTRSQQNAVSPARLQSPPDARSWITTNVSEG